METNRLFQTTSFEIDDKELTLRGCPDGTSFVFFVREREGGRRGREEGRRGREWRFVKVIIICYF